MKKLITVLALGMLIASASAQCPTFLELNGWIQGTYEVDEGDRNMWTPIFQGDRSGAMLYIPEPALGDGVIFTDAPPFHYESANIESPIQDYFLLDNYTPVGQVIYYIRLTKAGCPSKWGKLKGYIFNDPLVPEQMPPNPPPRG